MGAEHDPGVNPRTTPHDVTIGEIVSKFVAKDADVHGCHQAYADVVGRVPLAAMPTICTAAMEMARRHGIRTSLDSYVAMNPDGDTSIVVHLHRTKRGRRLRRGRQDFALCPATTVEGRHVSV